MSDEYTLSLILPRPSHIQYVYYIPYLLVNKPTLLHNPFTHLQYFSAFSLTSAVLLVRNVKEGRLGKVAENWTRTLSQCSFHILKWTVEKLQRNYYRKIHRAVLYLDLTAYCGFWLSSKMNWATHSKCNFYIEYMEGSKPTLRFFCKFLAMISILHFESQFTDDL